MADLDSLVSFYLIYRNFTTIATVVALGGAGLIFYNVFSNQPKQFSYPEQPEGE